MEFQAQDMIEIAPIVVESIGIYQSCIINDDFSYHKNYHYHNTSDDDIKVNGVILALHCRFNQDHFITKEINLTIHTLSNICYGKTLNDMVPIQIGDFEISTFHMVSHKRDDELSIGEHHISGHLLCRLHNGLPIVTLGIRKFLDIPQHPVIFDPNVKLDIREFLNDIGYVPKKSARKVV